MAELYRWTPPPPGGVLYNFMSSALLRSSKKNRFYLQQLPKKGHFLKEMHQKKNRKKVQKKFAPAALYRCPPPGWGCYRISVFCASAILPLYLTPDTISEIMIFAQEGPHRGSPLNNFTYFVQNNACVSTKCNSIRLQSYFFASSSFSSGGCTRGPKFAANI